MERLPSEIAVYAVIGLFWLGLGAVCLVPVALVARLLWEATR